MTKPPTFLWISAAAATLLFLTSGVRADDREAALENAQRAVKSVQDQIRNHLESSGADPSFCEEQLGAFRILDTSQGTVTFTPANAQFLKVQRDRVRQVYETLKSRYFQSEHLVRTIMLALMMNTHVFVTGEPGVAKTEIARIMAMIPDFETVKPGENMFFQLMHEMLGEHTLVGRIDGRELREGKKIQEAIQNAGTMITANRAVLDEIANTNPLVFQAILGALQGDGQIEYGPISFTSPLQTVIGTSNMTRSQVMRKMLRRDLETTGKALLDRIPFQVWMPGDLPEEKERKGLIEMGDRSDRNSADDALAGKKKFSARVKMGFEKRAPSEFEPIDFNWLGALANSSRIHLSDDLILTATHVLRDVKKANKTRETAVRKKLEDDPTYHLGVPYYPTQTISPRFHRRFPSRTIRTSLLLDLLLLPEEKLSTPELIAKLEQTIRLDASSTFRLGEILATAAPGRIQLIEENSTLAPNFASLDPFTQETSPADRVAIEDIRQEREALVQSVNNRVKALNKSMKAGATLKSLLRNVIPGSSGMPIEELIYDGFHSP